MIYCVKENKQDNNQAHDHLVQKTYTHTHRTNCSTWTTKVQPRQQAGIPERQRQRVHLFSGDD